MSDPAPVGLRSAGALLSLIGWPFRFRVTVRAIDWLSRRLLDLCITLGRRRTEVRLAEGRPKSLWGVTPIVTLPLKARADGLLGIRAESVVWMTYVITRNFDWNLRWLAGAVQRINPELLTALGRVALGVALLRYDFFHYFNDRGLTWPTRQIGLEPEELDILKRAGKRTYVFVYGADIRTRDTTLALGRWNFCTDCPEPGRFCICDEQRGRKQFAETAARTTAVVSMADMTAYTPGGWTMDYWPIDVDGAPAAPTLSLDGPLVVAHAPNHAHFKGTRYLEEAIATLQADGHAISLSRVSGVPNHEVMRLFNEADIVADQFIGGACGYTALEAMARGKPVLSYIRSGNVMTALDECPILQTRPETILEVLRWCLANRGRLSIIGAQGTAYIRKHHSIEAVASRFAELYGATSNAPEELITQWRQFIELEKTRCKAINGPENWQHPFLVGDIGKSEKRFET